MNIRLAKNSGFCFGVKRAIKLAEQTAKQYGRAITIGPIIHNPQMVENLSKAGVMPFDDIDLIKEGPVIIRSHGVPIETLKQLKEKKCVIIDATCPYVAKAHKYAKLACKEKYEIFILGNPLHPEIIALRSYIKGKSHIWEVGDPLPSKKLSKVAIICQTTQNKENLNKLTDLLLPLCNELRIFNTICNATNVRQESSLELAKKSDIMIVIGGKNSSNTKMLAQLCGEFAKTIHIETADEIDPEFRIPNPKFKNIGLTAGASTPDDIIIDVYNKIKTIVGNTVETPYMVSLLEDIPGYKEEPNDY
jgi:(E)-4-hydroxy-3-methyl-but-2-enyl pyrophosphate reductase